MNRHEAASAAKPGPPGTGRYPAELSQDWTLSSGGSVSVRPIRHDDDALEAAFARGLSRESTYQRMLTGAFKVTPEWVQSMTHIDYRLEMAFVATTAVNDVETFIGVARYVVDAATGKAEIAIVIADDWQRRGLGRRLLERLLTHATEACVREVEGIVLAMNKPMLALARSLGFTVHAEPGDATVVRIRRALAGASARAH